MYQPAPPRPRSIVDEHWPIKYPPYLSPAARDLVGKLLERRPARRIGMLSGKVADVKNHKCAVVGVCCLALWLCQHVIW